MVYPILTFIFKSIMSFIFSITTLPAAGTTLPTSGVGTIRVRGPTAASWAGVIMSLTASVTLGSKDVILWPKPWMARDRTLNGERWTLRTVSLLIFLKGNAFFSPFIYFTFREQDKADIISLRWSAPVGLKPAYTRMWVARSNIMLWTSDQPVMLF